MNTTLTKWPLFLVSIIKSARGVCLVTGHAERDTVSPLGYSGQNASSESNNEETLDKPKFDNDQVELVNDKADGGSVPQ